MYPRFWGSETEFVKSIAIDSDGNIYVTGETGSSDFPVTEGAYDTSYNYNIDIFISKLNGDLTDLISSTYLGGTYDYQSSIAIDSGGNVYVAGTTASSNFPTTTGAYDTSFSGYHDTFISKLDGALTNLFASTFLGI
ncbi:MAG: SBBP repeat-containing protein [Planctomycetia bacterium]|nr:SBBP repeat-containing protein [Planctomycetia bacterium]